MGEAKRKLKSERRKSGKPAAPDAKVSEVSLIGSKKYAPRSLIANLSMQVGMSPDAMSAVRSKLKKRWK